MPSTITDRIDGVTTSAAVKTPVKICTTTPITLSGVQTLQGVLLVAYTGPGLPADRVLVAGQTDTTTNGIYLVQTGAWTREPDFDGARDAVTGTEVLILGGTYANSIWILTCTDNPIIIGTSQLTFSQSSVGVFTATSTTSNTISVASKNFTINKNLILNVGQFLLIADASNASNYLHGQVTSYNATTGALVFNALDTGGTGTIISWVISQSGPQSSLGNNSVTNALLAQATAATLKGNPTNATANVQDISLSANSVLARGATLISAIALSASQLLGRGSSGDVAAITLGTNLSISSTTLNAAAGLITQQVRTMTGSVTTGSSTTPDDDTIPQSSEATQYMSQAITPLSSTSILTVDMVGVFSQSASNKVTMCLFRDATAAALAAVYASSANISNYPLTAPLTAAVTSASTASTTFKMLAGSDAGATLTFNGASASRKYGGVMASTIKITESTN